MNKLLPGQCRAARGLLNWSQSRLATTSNLSEDVIRNFEMGRTVASSNSLVAISTALEAAGIELIADGLVSGAAGIGVRLRFPAQIVKRIDIMENEGGPVGEDDRAP